MNYDKKLVKFIKENISNMSLPEIRRCLNKTTWCIKNNNFFIAGNNKYIFFIININNDFYNFIDISKKYINFFIGKILITEHMSIAIAFAENKSKIKKIKNKLYKVRISKKSPLLKKVLKYV